MHHSARCRLSRSSLSVTVTCAGLRRPDFTHCFSFLARIKTNEPKIIYWYAAARIRLDRIIAHDHSCWKIVKRYLTSLPTILTAQIEQSVGRVCVSMEDNVWTKWPMTWLFGMLIQFDPLHVKFEGERSYVMLHGDMRKQVFTNCWYGRP